MGATAVVVDALAYMARAGGMEQELAVGMRECRQEVGDESEPYAVGYEAMCDRLLSHLGEEAVGDAGEETGEPNDD